MIEALAADGVIDVRLVASFPDSGDFGVWLCTETDEQRDSLPHRSPRLEKYGRSCRRAASRSLSLTDSARSLSRNKRSIATIREAGSTRCANPQMWTPGLNSAGSDREDISPSLARWR
jgi:hypothetical protein